jgi:hypothetical protein
MRKVLAVLAGLLGVGLAAAQVSTSYKLTEHVFNAGGHPAEGVMLTSTSYRVTLDAIGDSVTGYGLSSASYRMDGSFGFCFPPPGEVTGLHFTDHQTLVWDAERSVGVYNLYRNLMSVLSGGDTGTCEQHDLTATTATDTDPAPSAGDGFFYLVTAENRLAEEGTKGWRSSGSERPNPLPCP